MHSPIYSTFPTRRPDNPSSANHEIEGVRLPKPNLWRKVRLFSFVGVTLPPWLAVALEGVVRAASGVGDASGVPLVRGAFEGVIGPVVVTGEVLVPLA